MTLEECLYTRDGKPTGAGTTQYVRGGHVPERAYGQDLKDFACVNVVARTRSRLFSRTPTSLETTRYCAPLESTAKSVPSKRGGIRFPHPRTNKHIHLS